MHKVSLVVTDLPLLTARGQTLPQLGVPVLAQAWAKGSRAIYKPQKPFALLEQLPSLTKIDEAIKSSVHFNHHDTSAKVHLLADERKLLAQPELESYIERRLPQQPLRVYSTDRLPYLIKRGELQENDLVLTPHTHVLGYYPAAKLIVEEPAPVELTIFTNHKSSQDIIQIPEEQHISVNDDRLLLELLQDELNSDTHEQVTLLLSSNSSQRDEWWQAIMTLLNRYGREIFFLGVPEGAASGWYPAGLLQRNNGRSHMESVPEQFNETHVRDGWQQFHNISNGASRLTDWMDGS